MKTCEQRQQFGRWLAAKREEAGFRSQFEAADRIGISRPQLARWETGGSIPRPEIIPAIVDAYEVSLEEVYEKAGYPVPKQAQLSPSSLTMARRFEQQTAHLPAARRAALVRAIDAMMAAAK